MPRHFSNALFISDIHLTEDRPEITRAFFDFLNWIPSSIDALFILGDFFEYWVGDDIKTPLSESVADALLSLSANKDIEIFFIPGNRDFALGPAYCNQADLTLLNDETRLTIGNKAIYASHGDLLCTDDKSYQRFRSIIRNPAVLFTLRKMPKPWRLRLARKLRADSRARFARNPVYIDVSETAVSNTFKRTQCDILIHGHTHLADIHTQKESKGKRMVLGDWDKVGWYGYIDDKHNRLKQFSIDAPSFDLN